jgi:ATP-dependent Lhr-like helicase
MIGGAACAYLERGGRSLLTFPAAADHADWVSTLAGLVHRGRVRRLQIESIDGSSAAVSTWADALREVGFAEGYKGLSLGS